MLFGQLVACVRLIHSSPHACTDVFLVDGVECGKGQGGSKAKAKEDAAKNALDNLASQS